MSLERKIVEPWYKNEIESKFEFVFNFQFCVTIQSIYIGVMNGNVKKR